MGHLKLALFVSTTVVLILSWLLGPCTLYSWSLLNLHSEKTFDAFNISYVVIFDAGSQGSRAHVYTIQNLPSEKRGQSFRILRDSVFYTEPGLSSFAKYPVAGADSLLPLLNQVEDLIPPHLHPHTPLVLRATAGLRLLPDKAGNNLLIAVYNMFNKSRFCLPPEEAVGIMDGMDEAVLAWLSISYLRNVDGMENGGGRHYPGMFDLGGGSAQLTFLPKDSRTLDSTSDKFIYDISSSSTLAFLSSSSSSSLTKLYAHSYLGLGLTSAEASMLYASLNWSSVKPDAKILYSPCLPVDLEVSLSQINWKKSWIIKYGTPISLTNPAPSDSSVFHDCYATAVSILTTSTVDRPKELLEHELFALSFMNTLARQASGLLDKSPHGILTIKQFRDAAMHYCANPSKENPLMCMHLTYVVALLVDGLGLPLEKKLNVNKYINNFEIGWPLGYAIDRLLQNN